MTVQVGYLVGGLVVVETLFSYPGIGQLILNAATGHDLPTLEASVLLIALVYTVANLLADVLYGLPEPAGEAGRRERDRRRWPTSVPGVARRSTCAARERRAGPSLRSRRRS